MGSLTLYSSETTWQAADGLVYARSQEASGMKKLSEQGELKDYTQVVERIAQLKRANAELGEAIAALVGKNGDGRMCMYCGKHTEHAPDCPITLGRKLLAGEDDGG